MLLSNAFGIPPNDERHWMDRVGREQLRIMRDETDAVVGTLGLLPMGQFFGGRAVPCIGIAGVGIAPTARGRGHGTTLMRASMRELAKEGAPLSSLYPATQRLYRKAGFEVAGQTFRIGCVPGDLGVGERGLSIRPAVDRDWSAIQRCYDAYARQRPGYIHRSAYFWERLRQGRPKQILWTYVVEEPKGDRLAITGYVAYVQESNGPGPYKLRAMDLVYTTPQAGRRLLTFVSDHGTVCDGVVWWGSAAEPLFDLVPELRLDVRLHLGWMLRIVRVEEALARRGYPKAIRGKLELRVEDDVVRENHGNWVLEVEGGEARVRPGGRGTCTLDVRALAMLYSGYRSAEQLASQGLVEASPRALALATAAFAGPAPAMGEMF